MHRFPIHLTFDGDTGDDDPDDQPYWDKLDFFTIVIISASGRIPDIIITDKIPFGGNDRHIPSMTRSHGPTMMFFDGDNKEIQPSSSLPKLFNHFTEFE